MTTKFMVHILESPSADDFLDGRHEGEVLRAALDHAGLPAGLHTVVSTATLGKALARVVGEHMADPGKVPVLHLSMHGNETGVALTSGEVLEWRTLGDGLALVNEALGGSAIVIMSTCRGFDGVAMAERETGLPFDHLVGPKETIAWPDTVAVFVAFYHHLIAWGGSISSGVGVMNSIVQKDLFSSEVGRNAQASWRFARVASEWKRRLREQAQAERRQRLIELANQITGSADVS